MRRIALKMCIYFLLLSFLGVVATCKIEKPKQSESQAAATEIAAYTQGPISKTKSIRVEFTKKRIEKNQLGQPLATCPFTFDPPIQGHAVFTSEIEIQFYPKGHLTPGQQYQASLSLDFLTAPFTFTFSVIAQDFDLGLDGLRAKDMKNQVLIGSVRTADWADENAVKQTLKATHNGKQLETTWRPKESDNHYDFEIRGIVRQENDTEVTLSWDAEPIGVRKKGEQTIQVLGFNTFALTGARVVKGKESYIELNFSDPIKSQQNLRGLIKIKGHPQLRFMIDGNVIQVYSQKAWSTTVSLKVFPGIRNRQGLKLRQSYSRKINFEEIKPGLRFVKSGPIVPTSQGLSIPIEVVNLKAVYVQALSIPGNNLHQFLQVNQLNGDREMKRVGRPIWQKRILLDLHSSQTQQWTRVGLDLTSLIEKHPGGMVRLQLNFGPQDISYRCKTDLSTLPVRPHDDTDYDRPGDTSTQSEVSSWDYAENQYNQTGNNEYSEWQLMENRNDPCHPGFYHPFDDHDIRVKRNILISDIGLIAKRGEDGSFFVMATDIKTAKPLEGVKLEIFNYQSKLLTQGKSGSDGTARMQIDGIPFLIRASYRNQKGYLRTDDGSALPVTHFDVGGVKASKGLRGFLYGERGIWRPGDTIYLTFILKDQQNRLPKNHPIHLELINPRGHSVYKTTQTESVGNFYHFKFETAADAPTGNWLVRIRMGGAVFKKTLKIETVRPNRLMIALKFDEKEILAPDNRIRGDLDVTWLHGAIAQELNTNIQVTMQPVKTTFKRFENYSFEDKTRAFRSQIENIFDSALDNKGHAKIEANIKPGSNAPGKLTAFFLTKVYEPGGSFSVDRFSLPYHPYTRYVGIKTPPGDKTRGMLLTDVKHNMNLAVVNPHGNEVDQATISCSLYKINWRWWWEKGQESLADYVGNSSYSPLQTGEVKIKNGRGSWQFEVKYPDWGRYLLTAEDKQGGHRSSKIVYIDWPGWAGRAQEEGAQGANMLMFTTDKKQYTVGEMATVNIPTPQAGRGWISLENSSRIISGNWFDAKGKQTRYTFKVTPDMAPNVYAHVSLFQPHLQTKNDLPIRLYGVAPIQVVDPKTRIKPVIETADVFAPLEPAKIRLREQTGQPMTYTLAIVDEGLLTLTRFQTPDPWRHFFTRESLGVKTWDLFDMVAGAYGASLEKMLAIGGDAPGETEAGQKRTNRFPPMVRYFGPFSLKAGETKTHTVDIPRYIGMVRIMAVAGNHRAYGQAHKSVFVRRPLMILGTLPRVLGPREEVELPVTVFALEEEIKTATVTVDVQGPIQLMGKSTKTVQFKSPGDRMVNFRLKTKDALGQASIRIKAQGRDENIEHHININIRMPGSPVTEVVDAQIDKGNSWTEQHVFPGVQDTRQAVLEVSRMKPIDLAKHLTFLIQYPHGCVEQTTSSVFPQLHLAKLLDLSKDQEAVIQRHIQAGIQRLIGFQTTTGGFGYWPGNAQPDDWSTSYAGHFLVAAKKAGYNVDPTVLSRWQNYQRQTAGSWSNSKNSQFNQAYRLYTLALSDSPSLGDMNRLKESENIQPRARWRLASAYKLAGQTQTAQDLVLGLNTEVKPYRELTHTYGSDLRDQAMILETLLLIGRIDKTQELADEIAKKLRTKGYHSTQATAFALLSMARYAELAAKSGTTTFSYRYNDRPEKAISSGKPLVRIDLDYDQSATAKIYVRNQAGDILYARLILSGIPPLGEETASNHGMRISVRYLDKDANEVSPAELEQGTDIIARVTVTNTNGMMNYHELSLSHVVPSGWEIHNKRLDEAPRPGLEPFDYQDIRDDRIYTYFDLAAGQIKSFDVLLSASYLGRFYLPMILVEAMYDTRLHASTLGKWIKVVRPGI